MHVVDLDGAFDGEPKNLDAVKRIIAHGMKVELGGGMRTEATIKRALDAGVSRVIIGTRACEDPEFLRELTAVWGDAIAVGIDAKNGYVALKGWVDTSETTALELAQRMSDLDVKTIIYTDISRDGMLTGPNFEAQQSMCESVDINVIASGGVAKLDDIIKLADMAKTQKNLEGVIIGQALYKKTVILQDALAVTGS